MQRVVYGFCAFFESSESSFTFPNPQPAPDRLPRTSASASVHLLSIRSSFSAPAGAPHRLLAVLISACAPSCFGELCIAARVSLCTFQRFWTLTLKYRTSQDPQRRMARGRCDYTQALRG